MSKIAEQKTLEAYPYNRAYTDNDVEYDGNFCNRLPYIEGYEQAEKDLALTWEDIQTIDNIVVDMARNTDWPLRGQEVFYTEVLQRFAKLKEEKKK